MSEIRRMLFLCALLLSVVASAQNISVTSFKLLENDLTANTAGTMERDQNGETAALIKVVTTEQGFVFDGGMVGIVKTKQGVGEVWVYVPHGIKKITVQHPQLGVLRDYYFPTTIEKAKTYEMVLTTGKVETIVTHSVNKQFVVFNVTPSNAVVEFGDEVLMVDGEGYATKSMPYGTYDYRVTCANYHTAAGKVTVNEQGKAEVKVTLQPNFGWIKLDGAEVLRGAYVFIDNERVGQLPFTTDNIKSGTHRIKVVKSMYKVYEREVAVQDNSTTEVKVEMVPNFANVTLMADETSEIWIDGEKCGKGQWTGPLEIGDYVVEVKRESHRAVSEVVQINSVLARTIQLKTPTPIYTSLEVSSVPLRATVYIDGVEVGETPLIKSNVLVGTRRVTLKRMGYESVERDMVVKEGIENRVSIELSEIKKSIDSSSSAGHKATSSASSTLPATGNTGRSSSVSQKLRPGPRSHGSFYVQYNSFGVGDFSETLEDMDAESDKLTGFTVGFNKAVPITSSMPLFLEVGAGLTCAWVKIYDEEESNDCYYCEDEYSLRTKQTSQHLMVNVPVNLMYKFQIPNSSIILEPYVGLNVKGHFLGQMKAELSCDACCDDIEEVFGELLDEIDEDELKTDYFDKDDMGGKKYVAERLNIGWQIGANVDFGKSYIGVSYGSDFDEFMDNDGDDWTFSALNITYGIRF